MLVWQPQQTEQQQNNHKGNDHDKENHNKDNFIFKLTAQKLSLQQIVFWNNLT